MTAERAIRFLAHEARTCRDRDTCEAFVLLLPAIMKILGLEKMEDLEAAAARYQLKQELIGLNGHVHQDHARAA